MMESLLAFSVSILGMGAVSSAPPLETPLASMGKPKPGLWCESHLERVYSLKLEPQASLCRRCLWGWKLFHQVSVLAPLSSLFRPAPLMGTTHATGVPLSKSLMPTCSPRTGLTLSTSFPISMTLRRII